jgi:hypothetical protein
MSASFDTKRELDKQMEKEESDKYPEVKFFFSKILFMTNQVFALHLVNLLPSVEMHTLEHVLTKQKIQL